MNLIITSLRFQFIPRFKINSIILEIFLYLINPHCCFNIDKKFIIMIEF